MIPFEFSSTPKPWFVLLLWAQLLVFVLAKLKTQITKHTCFNAQSISRLAETLSHDLSPSGSHRREQLRTPIKQHQHHGNSNNLKHQYI